MIEARIIADSVNPSGDRITSFIATYPRFIHSELMTHRMFSRNAASSRAIPIQKMIAAITENPARPVFWGRNQAGMQAAEELDKDGIEDAVKIWDDSMRSAVSYCLKLHDRGVHKQIANRVIEPYAHMTTLITATEYHNFFSLRAHKDAQPEFQALAYKMLGAYLGNIPGEAAWGQWHTVFGDKMPLDASEEQRLKVATARGARLSYLSFDGEMDVQKDLGIWGKLSDSGHWSPFEHCAMASEGCRSGNFVGWNQYRKLFPNENQVSANLTNIWKSRPDRIGSEIVRVV